MGPCAGGAVYSPAMTDFIFMVKDTSYMFVTGPDVVKTVTNERSRPRNWAAPRPIPANPRSPTAPLKMTSRRWPNPPPVRLPAAQQPRKGAGPALLRRSGAVWSQPRHADPRQPEPALRHEGADPKVADEGDFFEIQKDYAGNIITGFIRIEGQTVGVVANQPMVLAGCLDIDASRKAARFVRFCDAFEIPILTFVDVPGFLPGHGAGIWRRHQARREAAVRLWRGDGAQGHGDHPQGLWRGL
jgi:propionyl-CoA carboxylase beta chain